MLNGLRYYAEFTNQTFANASGDMDIFTLNPNAAGELAIVTKCVIRPTGGTADTGDAEEEFRPVEWGYCAAVGSGGSAFTPLAVPRGGGASQIVARTLDTTPALTVTTVMPGMIGSREGYEFLPTPEEYLPVFGGVTNDVLVLTMSEAFVDDVDFSGYVTWIEVVG